MTILDRFANVARPLMGFCAFVFISAMLPPSAQAQEILRLPDFPVDQVQPAADEGDPEALYILATVYFKGKRVARDYRKAADLFTRAADQGLALAQLHLGEMYFDGTKIPQNDAQALRWYQTAALQGMPWAQYGLGNVFSLGRGTAVDLEKAAYWYEQAAMQGHGMAQTELGLLYATGTGVALNLLEGYKWLALASAQGQTDAVNARDEVRSNMTASDIASAQRNAAAFKPMLHYASAELQRQKTSILDRAKGLIVAK